MYVCIKHLYMTASLTSTAYSASFSCIREMDFKAPKCTCMCVRVQIRE